MANYKMWLQDITRNSKAQELIEQKVKMFIEMYFNEKDDYAIEKFIKSFCEPLRYIENSIEKNNGIHADQLEKNINFIVLHKDEYLKKYEQTEMALISEIERQSRNFQIFLSAVKNNDK